MKNYFLLVLSLLLCQSINIQANSALCFLTITPAPETLQFIKELAQDAIPYDVDVFIMTDDTYFNLSTVNISSNLRVLQIPNKDCVSSGYTKTMSLKPNHHEVTAWDKALRYFCVLNKNYSFIWLIENDVFIPSVQAFRSLHQLYSNNSDLVLPHNDLNLSGDSTTWWWFRAVDKFIPPWALSVVNVVGLSRRMLIAINDYVQWRGEVPFHEFFFQTLAMHLNLTMRTPLELSTNVFRANYTWEQIRKKPNNLWHPFKDVNRQNLWRKRLTNQGSKHKNSIQLTDLEKLCDNETNVEHIEKQLKNFLINFEISKSQFSPNIRLSMRERFSHLAEQCRRQNGSKEVLTLIMQLADHAYKLPEAPMEELVKEKSSNHLRLEQALKENKEMIFRLLTNSSNSSKLHELRKQAVNLTSELGTEIKQQYKLYNQTQSSSTSINTTLPYRSPARVLSSNGTTTEKINRVFHKFIVPENDHLINSIGDKRRIIFLIFLIFCTLFIILWWQGVKERKYFVVIWICLLCIFCWCNE